jgi:hypothetical protein
VVHGEGGDLGEVRADGVASLQSGMDVARDAVVLPGEEFLAQVLVAGGQARDIAGPVDRCGPGFAAQGGVFMEVLSC